MLPIKATSKEPVLVPHPVAALDIGTIVLYRLSQADADAINRRREDAAANRDNMRKDKTGYQAHIGNRVETNEIFPMMIIRAWSFTCVNGKVMLDGTDDLWVESVDKGSDLPGHWTTKL